MRIQMATFGVALATLGAAVPALAVVNPVVAQIVPLSGSGVRGNATFFQLGSSVNVGLNFAGSPASGAADIRKGSCTSFAATTTMPLGVGQDTKLSNVKLEQLNGDVLLIHKTASVTSPPIACAEIKG